MIPTTYTIIVQKSDEGFYEAELEGQGVVFQDIRAAESFAQNLADKKEILRAFVVKHQPIRSYHGKGLKEGSGDDE